MLERKLQLKKKIEQLEEEAYKRELDISHLQTILCTANDMNDKLSEEVKALKKENKQLLQENVELLLRMRKILMTKGGEAE